MDNSRQPVITAARPAGTGTSARRARRGPGGSRRRRGRLAAVLAAAAALLAAVLAAVTVLAGSGPAAPPRVSVASLPYWSISNGTSVVASHRHDFTEASPWIYGLTPGGQVGPQYGRGQAAAVTSSIGRLRAEGLRIVPTIANITGGTFAYQPVARVLHDPALMRQQIAAIVALVRQHDYAGIDIDYEELRAADRQVFTTYITELAAALHAHGKILSVAVFAKTSNGGYGPRNAAQDYAAIGRAADQVRLMAYDNHWASSPPGPVAPIGWVRSVLGYARSQIPVSKIILGIPLYGYDWVSPGGHAGHGQGISWQQAVSLARQHAARIRYDTASQSPWFSYTDSTGRPHQVWFENPASSAAKYQVARQAGAGGVFWWMYGHAAPGTWSALSQAPAARSAPAPGGSP
ncbi:MAG: hypothetical protein LBI49_01310 [Nocardiopsaceae bacterium]|nr:hypothetical protein [Nocardiopsaceae bacterium]